MKRCPQCNRVESDEALSFCRIDGAPLVNDFSSFDDEAGTVRLDPKSTEASTTILRQTTNAAAPRCTGPTTVLSAQPTATTGPIGNSKSSGKKIGIVVLVTAMVAAISAVVVYSIRSKNTHTIIQSIAVMPFVNASGNSDVEYLSDGMTETLISSLSQLPNLNVKPRSSVFRYKGKETDPQTVAKELNVEAVLNGRFAQRGQEIDLFVE
jgi:TolB-like protein